MNLNVYYEGQKAGELECTRQGLYYLYRAACGIRTDIPLRLYTVCGMRSVKIGVLSKEGELTKKLSVREAGETPVYAVLGREDDGFLPWCGTVDGELLTDAYLRADGNTAMLAIPAKEGQALPLIAYAAQMEPCSVCGRDCLALQLTDGRPQLPEEPEKSEEPKELAEPE